MLVKPVHPKNALLPMSITLSGIVMLVKPVHPKNASSSMLVTLSGIVTLVKPVHPENALSPMLVTLPSSGMMLVLQPAINVLVSVSIMQLPAL